MGDRWFEWSVRTHGGDWSDADAARHGVRFARSLEVEQLIGAFNGAARREREHLAVGDGAVTVSCLKAAERHAGETCRTTLSLAWEPASVTEVDVLERPVDESAAELVDDGVAVVLGPNEVKTLLLTFD